eukprot:5397435-Pleurochrysis_carterae.AAC.2
MPLRLARMASDAWSQTSDWECIRECPFGVSFGSVLAGSHSCAARWPQTPRSLFCLASRSVGYMPVTSHAWWPIYHTLELYKARAAQGRGPDGAADGRI